MTTVSPVLTRRFGRLVTTACLVLLAPWPGPPLHAVQPSAAPDAALKMRDQARALRQAGQYDEALKLAEEALALSERERGPDDLSVANALHVIGLTLDDKHEYQRAEPVTRRALAIREKVLGPDHPDVALSLANLAWLVQVRQDFAGPSRCTVAR